MPSPSRASTGRTCPTRYATTCAPTSVRSTRRPVPDREPSTEEPHDPDRRARPPARRPPFSLLAKGHALLGGVPGLGKTMLVRTIADVVDCAFSRIQFTPDLMPADITGTNILIEDEGRRQFRFQPGPIFANLVLAHQINP